ncbi:SDR family oxidoreductase [Pendulispora albinea]|uniref:SDR family oxidoreductase n=1 Tax=Pendulispora albinea TaxID=2741071 RepID=A0ABZ2LLX7_9BACT
MPTPSKIVLVTGASSGLGLAMARHLHLRGHRVYGTSRAPREDAPWPMLELDVCSDDSANACVGRVLEREGRLDVLINNAGYAFLGALEETRLEDARAQMETNFFGALRMMLAVLPILRRQSSGHIVNVSSISGAVGMPFAGAYAASKHALEGASEALAHELHGSGLRVTLIEPDGMRTGIGARFQQPAREHPLLGAKRKRLVAVLENVTAEGGDGIDPEVLARAVGEAIESASPPLRIVIGEKAQKLITAKRFFSEPAFANLIAELAAE